MGETGLGKKRQSLCFLGHGHVKKEFGFGGENGLFVDRSDCRVIVRSLSFIHDALLVDRYLRDNRIVSLLLGLNDWRRVRGSSGSTPLPLSRGHRDFHLLLRLLEEEGDEGL